MFARTILPLMQREWLQHRFGWTLLALIPLGLALLTVTVGQLEFNDGLAAQPQALPLLLSLIPAVIGTALMLGVALVTGFINTSGLARRDHSDRSNEFWLSLPLSHQAALGVPLVVHLVLMPAAAMLFGWISGQLMGVLLVGRVVGVSAIAEVPWMATLAASSALALRFVAGLPLAVLWALPVILLIVLLNAWFKRWGWVVLAVGLGLLALFDQLAFGQRWLIGTLGEISKRSGQALMGAGGANLSITEDSGVEGLLQLPAIAARDFAAAVAALGSPLFVAGLAFAAGCFVLLMRWRQNSSGRAD